jgi:1-acyl-sn-glycerol-3-phosphate acyltransferase
MTQEKAGKIQLYYIAFMTGVYTLWSCIKIISGSFLVKNYRPYIDRIMTKWAERLLRLVSVEVSIVGEQNIKNVAKDRPVIVMCNHSSLYDMPVIILGLNTSFRFVAKKELYRIPIFGYAIRKAEFISIDRQNHEQAMKDLEDAKAKMLDGITLWMAPEGTRSKDGKLAKFKKGAFHIALDTQAVIVPAVIKDIHKLQAGNTIELYPKQNIEVEICKPIDAVGYTKEERGELILKVRESMLAALGQND